MKKTLIKIASIVTAFLIVVVLFAIVLLKPNTDTLAAGDLKITVNKSTAVSVYVTGIGVELDSSSSFQDIYSYESGTSFTLTAVNEKKIFTGWEVYKENDTTKQTNLASGTGESSRKVTLTSDANVTVSYTSRNSKTEDYGKFTGDRYSIKDGRDIVALQEIINRGPNPTDRNNLEDLYQRFYPDLDLTTALGYYENLRTGYFVVNNNISLFKEEKFNEETSVATDDFTVQFTGIGTSTYPFEGVFTGPSETESSQIVSVINVTSSTSKTEFGLFGAIGSNAVIRSIDANTSIGISGTVLNTETKYIKGISQSEYDSLTTFSRDQYRFSSNNGNYILALTADEYNNYSGDKSDFRNYTINGATYYFQGAQLYQNSNFNRVQITNTRYYYNTYNPPTLTDNLDSISVNGKIDYNQVYNGVYVLLSDTDYEITEEEYNNLVATEKANYIEYTITNSSDIITGDVYAGCLAGIMDNYNLNNVESFSPTLVNVNTSGSINITSAYDVYSGILAGYIDEVNIDSISNIGSIKEDSSIMVNTTGDNYSGHIAGKAVDMYVKKLNLDVSGLSIILRNEDSSSDTYAGVLFGEYQNTKSTRLENIKVNANKAFRVEGYVDYASSGYSNSYTGGIAGRMTAGGATTLGSISLTNTDSNTSVIRSNTVDASSKGNCFAGGLFGEVSSTNVTGDNNFKYRIAEEDVDGKVAYKYNPVFTGNIEIEALQNGEGNGSTYGKAVAGGLVGRGIININGTTAKPTTMVLSKEGNLSVNATQSRIAKFSSGTMNNGVLEVNGDSDYEHCASSLVFGIFNTDNSSYKFSNIKIYSEGSSSTTTREIGSLAMGHISNGAFLAYADGKTFENIHLYLNECDIISNSLSYQVKGTSSTDANNAHVGGVLGFISNTTGNLITSSNISLNGVDWNSIDNKVGTTTRISSIQNTIPPGGDYKGENYVGGIFGKLYKMNLSNIIYNGSTQNSDYIIMSGHENPDSAFCGGIIGYIKMESNAPESKLVIENCKVKNADILGEATNTDTGYDNPDIYVGGIIGATYTDNASPEITLNALAVENSNIKAISNEKMEVLCAGIIAGFTWRGNTLNITNCYIADSTITAISSDADSYSDVNGQAAGIIAHSRVISGSGQRTIANNAIINTTITASEYAAGIMFAYRLAGSGNHILNNNYSNAVLSAGTTKYGIAPTATTYSNNYFHSENINSSSGIGTAVRFNDRVVTGSDNEVSNINRSTSYLKYMLASGDAYQVGTNNVVSLDSAYSSTVVSDDLHLWVNFKGQGTLIPLDTSKSKEALYEEGWFDMGSFMIYNIAYNGTADEIGSINNSYVYESDEYIDVERTGSDIKFETTTFPKKEYADIGYTKNSNTSYDIRVYDNIPSLVLKIKLDDSSTKLYERFFTVDANSKENEIDASTGVVGTYGTYTINKTDGVYELVFTPNVSITSDSTIKIKFLLGFNGTEENATAVYDATTITLNLISNKLNLVGVKYAEYTPAVNDYKYPQTDKLLAGQYRNDSNGSAITYILPASSIIKFVPIVTKSNDINELYGKLYDDERYIEKITYENGPKSSGELETGSSGADIEITLTLKEGAKNSVSCKYSISTKYDVTYSVIGMTPEAIPYATSGVIYEFKCYVNNGYSGTPRVLTIGGISYIDVANLAQNASVKIFNQDGAQLCNGGASWNDENTYYLIQIDNISKATEIVVEFPHIYTITFDLQCSEFNPNVTEEVKSYKLEEGDSFSTFFNSKNDEIDNWVVNNTLFGYVFTGFYLVDEANNVNSYGLSYDDILAMTDYKMSTSFTFYARWSFLIELVEAPGTTISSSFGEDFMVELDPKDYPEIAKAIMVPLNNKEGYVFTVEKDEHYIGEAYVEAYVITENADGRQVVTSITVEKYHENMYLYHIPTEKIQGFLMIVTSISNSGFIVGENTASVTEEILPEDGIYTYKYVVNHLYNSEEQSYIYNSGNVNAPLSNLDLTKDFILLFSKQGFDNTNLVTTLENRYLDKGTVIEVYYHKYVNGNLSQSIVATKEIKNSTTNKLFLSEFTLLDKQTPAFKSETFRQFLGGSEAVSEVYYVVITPPNGLHNLENEIVNYVVEGGYYSQYSYERKLTLAEYSNTLQGIVYPETDGLGNTWRQIITKDIYNSLSEKIKDEFRKIFIDYDGNGTVEEVYYHSITDDEQKIAKNHKFDTTSGYRMIITEAVYNSLSSGTLKSEFAAISYDYDGNGVNDNCYYKDVTEYDKIVCDSCKLERITDADGNAYIQLLTQEQYDAITDSTLKSNFIYIPFVKGIRSGKHFVNSPIESGHQAHFVKVESSNHTRVYSVTPSRITEIVDNKFTDDKTYEIFELSPETGGTITVTSDNKISLSPTTGKNAIVSNTLPFNIAELYVTLGYGTGDVQILGGINEANFRVLKTINLATINYTEHVIPFITTSTTDKFNCFKIVSNSANEILISSLSVVSMNNGMKYTLDKFIADNNKVSFNNEIVNDTRHDGKTFMLELQLYTVENGNKVICENIPAGQVKLVVGTKEYLPVIDSSIHGKVSAYFNLSAILKTLQDQDSDCVSFEYSLVYPNNYLVQTELLEVENANKPAMSEVRRNSEKASLVWSKQGYSNLLEISMAEIDEVTLTITKGDGANNSRYYNQVLHVYTNNQLKFKANNGYSVNTIVINCNNDISLANFTTSNCSISVSGSKIFLDATNGSSEIVLEVSSDGSSIEIISIDIIYN